MVTSLDERTQREIMHSQKLRASGNPEQIWNWDTPAGRNRAQRRARLIAKVAGLAPGVHVMEVGCGTGLFTEMFSVYGAHILAIDISADLLTVARSRNLPQTIVEFREMRFEDGAIEGPFDAIIGSSVLHHLDIELALKHMFALLNPGGVIAFAEPNMLNPQVWAERHIPFIRERNGVSPDETAIVRWLLVRSLFNAGFVSIQFRNKDWLHPASHPVLITYINKIGLVL